MKLDTAKNGINAIWKNYEVEAITFLLEVGEEGSGSRDVFEHCLFKQKQKGKSVSRSSVILFLNRLVDDGLATFTNRMGKGGFRRIYALIERTQADFNNSVIDKILYKLWETYPENRRISEAIKS